MYQSKLYLYENCHMTVSFGLTRNSLAVTKSLALFSNVKYLPKCVPVWSEI